MSTICLKDDPMRTFQLSVMKRVDIAADTAKAMSRELPTNTLAMDENHHHHDSPLPVLHSIHLLCILFSSTEELSIPNLHPEDSLSSTEDTESKDNNDLDWSRCSSNGL